MKVLVTGSTGFVGEALVSALKRKGHQVVRLVRRPLGSGDKEISWDPAKGKIDTAALAAENVDAVIHLAGENIAGGRWTEERKQRIQESRVKGTRLLSEALASLPNPPKHFLSSSAIGYYGNRGEELLTEVSGSSPKGFLPKVCREWEASTEAAEAKGIPTAYGRIGVVLDPQGGALKAMYWPFQMGVAGNLGLTGKQYMSWITREDLVNAMIHVMEHGMTGPVNLVAPNPVRNREFTDAMRKTLIWPVFPMYYWTPPAPGLAVSALLGEMADELLLASTRVVPVRLEETGFHFQHPEIRQALKHLF